MPENSLPASGNYLALKERGGWRSILIGALRDDGGAPERAGDMKKILDRMSVMCAEARYIYVGTLKLSCAMLLCAFMLLCAPGADFYEQHLAAALYETPQGLLLIATIASVILEEKRG